MIEKHISTLFEKTFGKPCHSITLLPASGSNRNYYRVCADGTTVIAAYNPVKRENEAYFHFTDVFLALNLRVPKLYGTDTENDIYIVEDLGDTTVYEACLSLKQTENGILEIEKIFEQIIRELIKFQILPQEKIDYNKAFPRHSFDKQSIMWDLNYFKYYFLKVFYIPFDEQLLEDDFNAFAAYLTSIESPYFMYRDFQSRNIMLKDDNLYFIDYQGGRKGPLHYDLASLLYSAKTDLPQDMRDRLLNYYISQLAEAGYEKQAAGFGDCYHAFVLVRILQALGAYGYRGVFERKAHFIDSIPPAVKNLDTVYKRLQLPFDMPELLGCIERICKTSDIGSVTQ